MRTLFLGGLMLALVPSALEAQTAPVFQFRDLRADQVIDNRAAGFKECTNLRDGSRLCFRRSMGDSVAGQFVIPKIILWNNRLAAFELTGIRNGYPAIRAAFQEKYGQPCQTRTDTWRNAVGAALDNEITIWCFATGKMELRAIGQDVNEFDAVYVDSVNSPPSAPKVDF